MEEIIKLKQQVRANEREYRANCQAIAKSGNAIALTVQLINAGERDREELFARLVGAGHHELTAIDAIETVLEWQQ